MRSLCFLQIPFGASNLSRSYALPCVYVLWPDLGLQRRYFCGNYKHHWERYVSTLV